MRNIRWNDSSTRSRPRMMPAGSAMILVVVLTVLLSLVGVIFVMASRLQEAGSTSANRDRDLSAGVDAVTDRINKVLVDDLFGSDREAHLADGTRKDDFYRTVINEAFDFAGDQDRWLSANDSESEDPYGTPDHVRDDLINWRHVSDLYYDVSGIYRAVAPGLGGLVTGMKVGPDLFNASDGRPMPRVPNDTLYIADADGDGVWDSVWVRIPKISTAKGEPMYAAVRIIDNGAMLNLNTAFRLSPNSSGAYLSAVDYERFLRGSDRDPIIISQNDLADLDSIRKARMANPNAAMDTVRQYHDNVIMKIENPGNRYRLFDLTDELEIRNRFLLTSNYEARFERRDISYFTFNAASGKFEVLALPRNDEIEDQFTVSNTYYERSSFDKWKFRCNSKNFDDTSGAYYNPSEDSLPENQRKLDYRWRYDRRHVCTFYSFDRNIRSGFDPILDPVIGRLRKDWLRETNPSSKDTKKSQYEIVRTIFRPTNGSVVSTRDLIVGKYVFDGQQQVEPVLSHRYKQVVQLLYALRAFYLTTDNTAPAVQADLDDPDTAARFDGPKVLLGKAAVKAAQTVANMIDYLDDNDPATEGPFFADGQKSPDPTVIDEALILRMIRYIGLNQAGNPLDVSGLSIWPELAFGLYKDNKAKTGPIAVYGYERQPFISEIYCTFSTSGIGRFAVEFVNPYDQDIKLEGWRIVVGNPKSNPRQYTFTASNNVIVPKGTPTAPGRFVLRNLNWGTLPNNTPTYEWAQLAGASNGFVTNDVILLQRPIPGVAGSFLTVDQTEPGQINSDFLQDGPHSLKRDEKAWKYANSKEMVLDNGSETLGRANGIDIPQAKGFQMPVADNNSNTTKNPISTLGDFEKILSIGNIKNGDDPNSVTYLVGLASDEGDVRIDIEAAPELFGYIGFLGNRQDPVTGDLPKPQPGRININTATKEVIRAAIPVNPEWFPDDPNAFPDGTAWARDWVDKLAAEIAVTGQDKAHQSLTDLLRFDEMKRLKNHPSVNVGDPSIRGDFEERDWILSRLSNIFTVRSDTFTAYIALRIGPPRVIPHTDPTRRVIDVDADRRYIAIFDRSEVDEPDESPRLVALHPVPDAR